MWIGVDFWFVAGKKTKTASHYQGQLTMDFDDMEADFAAMTTASIFYLVYHFLPIRVKRELNERKKNGLVNHSFRYF